MILSRKWRPHRSYSQADLVLGPGDPLEESSLISKAFSLLVLCSRKIRAGSWDRRENEPVP